MNASRRLGTTTDVRRSQLLWQGTPQPTQLRRPAPSLTSMHFTWRLDQPPLSSWLDCASLALLLPPPPTHGRPNKLLSTSSQTCCPSPVILMFSYELTTVIFIGLGLWAAWQALAPADHTLLPTSCPFTLVSSSAWAAGPCSCHDSSPSTNCSHPAMKLLPTCCPHLCDLHGLGPLGRRLGIGLALAAGPRLLLILAVRLGCTGVEGKAGHLLRGTVRSDGFATGAALIILAVRLGWCVARGPNCSG